jgi:hypothetical protein
VGGGVVALGLFVVFDLLTLRRTLSCQQVQGGVVVQAPFFTGNDWHGEPVRSGPSWTTMVLPLLLRHRQDAGGLGVVHPSPVVVTVAAALPLFDDGVDRWGGLPS